MDGLMKQKNKCSLMGVLAQQALKHGTEVIGVEPVFFVEQEIQLKGLTQLIVAADMRERKARMMELSDAFIAFSGGTGTAAEIAEVISAWSPLPGRASMVIIMWTAIMSLPEAAIIRWSRRVFSPRITGERTDSGIPSMRLRSVLSLIRLLLTNGHISGFKHTRSRDSSVSSISAAVALGKERMPFHRLCACINFIQSFVDERCCLCFRHCFFIKRNAHENHFSISVFRNDDRNITLLAGLGDLRCVFEFIDRYYFW